MSTIDGGDFSALRRSTDEGGHGVEYDPRHAVQTLPLLPEMRRRSKPIGPASGYFIGILENNHGAADGQTSIISPYSAGDVAVGPYPQVIPEGWDLWVLGISAYRISGVGDITGSHVGSNAGADHQGFGEDEAGAQVVATRRICLAFFDALDATVTDDNTEPFLTPDGTSFVRHGMRLPRGGDLSFMTESTGAAVFQCAFNMALFPMAMGQDVLV